MAANCQTDLSKWESINQITPNDATNYPFTFTFKVKTKYSNQELKSKDELARKTNLANVHFLFADAISIAQIDHQTKVSDLNLAAEYYTESNVTAYFKKSPPNKEHYENNFKFTKKFKIKTKVNLTKGYTTDETIKSTVKILDYFVHTDGFLWVKANVPTEWEQYYIVCFVSDNVLQIYSPVQQTGYILYPSQS